MPPTPLTILRNPAGSLRSAISGNTAAIFGATGFLGRYLTNQLGKHGTQVITAYRGDEDTARHLKIMGDLGQIVPLRFSLKEEQTIGQCMRNCNIVYNLIGRETETRNFSFEDIYHHGPRKLARIAKEQGIPYFVHLSALNANPDSKNDYLRAKGRGEKAVLEEFPEAIIVRPGKMFGHEDKLFNYLGTLTGEWPRWLLLNHHVVTDANIYPIYVGDVARALEAILARNDPLPSQYVELYGDSYTWAELAAMFCRSAYRSYKPLYVPQSIFQAFIKLWKFYPHSTLTPSIVERLYISEEPKGNATTFADLGIVPKNIEDCAITYTRFYRAADATSKPANDVDLRAWRRMHPETSKEL